MSIYKIPADVKQQILSRVKKGVPVSTLASQHGISSRTVYGWLSKRSTSQPSGLKFGRLKRERDDLIKIVGELTLKLTKAKKK